MFAMSMLYNHARQFLHSCTGYINYLRIHLSVVSSAKQLKKELKGQNVPFNTLHIISETIFPANFLTGAKRTAFSANHMADINKTQLNYN